MLMDYEIIENTHTYTYNISQRIASIREERPPWS
jgi:hypothetical protein